MQLPRPRDNPPAPIEREFCLLCGERLVGGWWCNQCQMSVGTIERIFRAERLEEARTPCGPLVFLVLATTVVAVSVIIWAVLRL